MAESDRESDGAGDGGPVPPPFAIVPAPAPDGAAVLALEGELDLAAAPDVRLAVDMALNEGARLLVLDLGPALFMDSSILRELVIAHGRLAQAGGRLVLARPSTPVLRLFELTRATDLLTVADSVESALADGA
jgi:anti-anti-sigma factor